MFGNEVNNPNMIVVSPPSMSPFSSNCKGDSGSSLICMQDSVPIAAGVLSYGIGNCIGDSNKYDVFTKTTYFLPWIKQTMVRNQKCTIHRFLQHFL